MLEFATPSSLEALGNVIIETQDAQVVVDTITHLLEKNQEGCYDSPVSLSYAQGLHQIKISKPILSKKNLIK